MSQLQSRNKPQPHGRCNDLVLEKGTGLLWETKKKSMKIIKGISMSHLFTIYGSEKYLDEMDFTYL